MNLTDIQERFHDFLKERDWLDFSPSDVLLHLYEELSEIGDYLLFKSKYKTDVGHKRPNEKNLPREFAQAFSLFLQLCIYLDIDLEEAWHNEIIKMKERFPIDKQK
jgi:NTP pyrophosphatase (non-canonical NTP hydrolase)